MADTIIIKDEKGQEIQDITILSVAAEHEFNKVPKAEIKLTEGDIPSQKYENLDSDHFKIGKKIGISIREEGDPKTEIEIFKGVVVNLRLEISDTSSEGHTLLIDLSDETIRMTNGRFSDVYTNKTDAKIIEKLITANKLKHNPIKGMKTVHREIPRPLVTDWDFMVIRGETNGQLVDVKDGKISLIQPEIKKKADHTIDFGIEPCHVYDLQLQANGSDQYGAVEALVWDPSKLQMAKPVEGKYALEQGDYDTLEFAEVVGTEVTPLVQATPMTKGEIEAWSNAQVMKSRLSLLTGSFKIAGRNGKFEVGETVEIKGIGDRNSGKNIVTGVQHECSNSDHWTTEVHVGMDADWFSSQADIVDVPAAGLLPGVHGLQLGVVADQKKEDPDKQFRVKVSIPVFGIGKDKNKGKVEVKENTVWARLASIDAGPERGVFFRPEKGDEVVVGFLNDDPRHAIILGAMHSKKNKTPASVTTENGQKGIFTKLKYQLLFDEEKKMITLSTSDKNKICINEDKGYINLEDAHGNQVELSEKGITIISFKDCQINAKGDLNLEAKGNVKIKGKKVDLI